jgi:hypothetical protein
MAFAPVTAKNIDAAFFALFQTLFNFTKKRIRKTAELDRFWTDLVAQVSPISHAFSM